MKLIRLLKHDLAGEARAWIEQGYISAEHANQILAHYGTSLRQSDRRPVGFLILSSLAVLFIGVALILLVSHNWEEIPRAVRMLSVVGLTAFLNSMGIHEWSKARHDRSRLWFIIGSIAYGASIFLIAQTYHLPAHFPDGILLWVLGILPIAYLSRSTAVMLISSALSFTWMWSEASNMTMTWSYPLLVAPCVYYCLVVKRSIIIFLASVAGLITYTQLVTAYLVNDSTYGVFDVGVEHAVVTAAVAFVLMLIGKRMSELPCESSLVDYGISLRLWAARLGIAVLFVMSFEATWLGLLSSRAFVLACLASVVLAQSYSFYKALKEGRGLPVFELIYSGAFAFCTLALLIGERTGGGVALVLLIQLLIVGTGASLIYQGAKATQHSKVVTGTLVLLMFAFIRYIDLFGNYIGASLLFMLEGVILYAVASRLRKQTNLIEE